MGVPHAVVEIPLRHGDLIQIGHNRVIDIQNPTSIQIDSLLAVIPLVIRSSSCVNADACDGSSGLSAAARFEHQPHLDGSPLMLTSSFQLSTPCPVAASSVRSLSHPVPDVPVAFAGLVAS